MQNLRKKPLIEKKFNIPLILCTLSGIFCYSFIDFPLSEYLASHQTYAFSYLSLISNFYDPITLFSLLTIILLSVWTLRANLEIFSGLWIQFVTSIPVFKLLKIFIARPRPLLAVNEGVAWELGPRMQNIYHSFPSGHALAVSLICIWWIKKKKRSNRWLGLAVFFGSIRAVLLKHYLSDIFITIAFAIIHYQLIESMLIWAKKNRASPALARINKK